MKFKNIFKFFFINVVLNIFLISSASGEITKVTEVSVTGAHGMYLSGSSVWLADTYLSAGNPSRIFQVGDVGANVLLQGQGFAGLSRHPHKSIYSVCDLMGSRIVWFDERFQVLQVFNVSHPWNARWSPDGKDFFAVSYDGKAYQLKENLTFEPIINNLDAPFDLAVVDANEIWVSEQGAKGNGRVCRFSKLNAVEQWKVIACNLGAAFKNPEGLWLVNDSVLVVDTEDGTLFRVSHDGQTTTLQRDLGIPILVQALTDSSWVVFSNSFKNGHPALIYGLY